MLSDRWVRGDIIYFDLVMILILAIVAILLLYAPGVGSLALFIPAAGVIFNMIVTYNLGLQRGLIAAIILTFIYGSYIIYQTMIVHKISEVNFAYVVWLFLYPLSSLLAGQLSGIVTSYNRELENRKTLEQLVTIDASTGFYNTQGFFKKLDEEFLRAKRYKKQFSILLIKIANFDALHNIYGDVNSVKILQSVANIITTQTRFPDVKSVVEGNMLSIILAETDEDGAKIVIEKLHQFLDSITTEINGIKKVIRIKPSIGVASMRECDNDALEMYERAKEEFNYDKG